MAVLKIVSPNAKVRRRRHGPVTRNHPEGYRLGHCAREAQAIAEWCARRLPEALPPGPESSALVRRIASMCPFVMSDPQCEAVVAGFENRWPGVSGSARIAICRSAGRQLAAIKEVLQ